MDILPVTISFVRRCPPLEYRRCLVVGPLQPLHAQRTSMHDVLVAIVTRQIPCIEVKGLLKYGWMSRNSRKARALHGIRQQAAISHSCTCCIPIRDIPTIGGKRYIRVQHAPQNAKTSHILFPFSNSSPVFISQQWHRQPWPSNPTSSLSYALGSKPTLPTTRPRTSAPSWTGSKRPVSTIHRP